MNQNEEKKEKKKEAVARWYVLAKKISRRVEPFRTRGGDELLSFSGAVFMRSTGPSSVGADAVRPKRLLDAVGLVQETSNG